MTRSKLSDSDKQTITQLFRESEETIAQLATRFEVSSSTIRRIIKSQLPDQEYDALIATKQEKRGPKSSRSQTSAPVAKTEVVEEPKSVKVIDAPVRPAPIKKRKRTDEPAVEAAEETPSLAVAQLDDQEDLAEIIAEIEHDLHDLPASNVEEDTEIDEFDSDDSEDADLEDGVEAVDGLGMNLEAVELIQVLPFSEAKFPKTCYLVVDRSSELITRPLQAFGELGTIPEQEVDAKTLPIFDNHRIARRFSHRTQRIVKVPNSNVLKKTCPQLLAKGITRLLINGHVYSL